MKTVLFYFTILSCMINIAAMDVDNFNIIAPWCLVNFFLTMVCIKVLAPKDIVKASGYKQFMRLLKK